MWAKLNFFLSLQVKAIFGDREDLILPLILDIANLIKIAGNKAHEIYYENELAPTYQSLRRSFIQASPFKTKPVAEAQKSGRNDDEEEESVAKVVDITRLVQNNQRDDKFSVDEGEVIIKDNDQIDNLDLLNDEKPKLRSSIKTARSLDVPRAERLIQQINHEKLALSYHERKFNMSAFNATKTHLDQEAMASDHEGIVSVVLPDDISQINTRQNMTMDDLEDFVLRSFDSEDEEEFEELNLNKTSESLPMPEQLIAYKRIRPKGKRPPPPPSNGRKVSPAVNSDDCEIFSGSTICLLVKNYPM